MIICELVSACGHIQSCSKYMNQQLITHNTSDHVRQISAVPQICRNKQTSHCHHC